MRLLELFRRRHLAYELLDDYDHEYGEIDVDKRDKLRVEKQQLQEGWQQKENEAVEAMNRADEIRAQALSEGRRADDMEKERDEARAWWTRESYTVDRLKAREQRLQEALERIEKKLTPSVTMNGKESWGHIGRLRIEESRDIARAALTATDPPEAQ